MLLIHNPESWVKGCFSAPFNLLGFLSLYYYSFTYSNIFFFCSMRLRVRVKEDEGRRPLLFYMKTRSKPFISLKFVHLSVHRETPSLGKKGGGDSFGKLVKSSKFSMSINDTFRNKNFRSCCRFRK